MKRTIFIAVSLLFVFCLGVAAQAGIFDKYLSPGDIEKVTGFKGVKLSQSSGKGLFGNETFRDGNKHLILKVRFMRVALYKKDEAKKLGLVKADVKGIGEDAYIGPKVDDPYIVSFKKGPMYVDLSSFYNSQSKGSKLMLFINIDQLETLAKIVASHI